LPNNQWSRFRVFAVSGLGTIRVVTRGSWGCAEVHAGIVKDRITQNAATEWRQYRRPNRCADPDCEGFSQKNAQPSPSWREGNYRPTALEQKCLQALFEGLP